MAAYRGFNTRPEVSGKDFVICKLCRPLGNAIGWMGTKSFGNEGDFYRRSCLASGYSGHYGQRPAVELDLGIRDIERFTATSLSLSLARLGQEQTAVTVSFAASRLVQLAPGASTWRSPER